MKRLHRAAAWWFGFTLLGFLFWPEIAFIWLFFPLLMAVSGLGIGLTYLFNAMFSQRRAEAAAGALVVASALYLGATTDIGRALGVYRTFFWNRAYYAREVARIESMTRTERAASRQRGVCVDEGPPLRVAFSLGGCLDNWSGIVHDPTGLVLRAREFKRDRSNRHAPELEEVEGLFGGLLIHAWRIWGPWYFCSFT